MVHWGWLVVTAIASSILTVIVFCALAINRDNQFEE